MVTILGERVAKSQRMFERAGRFYRISGPTALNITDDHALFLLYQYGSDTVVADRILACGSKVRIKEIF